VIIHPFGQQLVQDRVFLQVTAATMIPEVSNQLRGIVVEQGKGVKMVIKISFWRCYEVCDDTEADGYGITSRQ
jgi:hypothetical protein